MSIHINRLPDCVRLVTETGKYFCRQEGSSFCFRDVQVKLM
ncbi:hypothetical protein [Anaerocolumna jejuensis]